MQIKIKYLLFLCLGLSILACSDKSDEINISVKDYGTLQYTITDVNGEPLTGGMLFVFDFNVFNATSPSFSNFLDLSLKSMVSDSEGIVDFGELNSGLYYVYGEVQGSDNRTYLIQKIVQVHSKIESQEQVSLAEYVGSLSIVVNGFGENYSEEFDDVDTLNIVLIPYGGSSIERHSFNALMNQGTTIGKTTASGALLVEKIPIGNYYVLGYYDEQRYDLLSSSAYSNFSLITVKKGSENQLVLYAENSKLEFNTPDFMEFHVFYTELNTETNQTDTVSLSEVNVVLTSTSSSSLANAMQSEVFSIPTNAKGVARSEITEDLYNSYYLWVYKDITSYTRVGGVSLSQIKNKLVDLEVNKDDFHKVYGSVEINAKGKYVSGLTLDTMLLANTNLKLTKVSSTYFNINASGFDVETDENGNARFEKVPVGTYYLWAYSDENHADRSVQLVVVTENETLKLESVFEAEKALKLNGDLNLEFYGNVNGSEQVVKDAYVILTKNSVSSVSSALNYAYKSSKTNENGKVSFKDLPVNESYYVIVYYDLERYYRYYSGLIVRYKSNETNRIEVNNRMFD